MRPPRVAVAPRRGPGGHGAPPGLAEAVEAGGGVVVDPDEAEALVWGELGTPGELAEILSEAPGIRWVQLPMAGVERFVHLMGDGRSWTSGKGVYAQPVAEHALALLMAGLRNLPGYARAREWSEAGGGTLFGARVAILGAGGIAEALLRLLTPFGVEATVVRRRPDPVPGAARVVGPEGLHDALAAAEAVVVALALTRETRGIVGRAELEAMPGHSWLVNVARGGHVVTDDLVATLSAGAIAGAALDVTDPEPLPPGHPLWSLPNCLVTPHVAGNSPATLRLLGARIAENVGRFAAGQPLVGPVDPTLGY